MNMLITYVWSLVMCCSLEHGIGSSVFDWEITFEPTNTLILHLTFGYHQAGINRPILDSLETVCDRAVSLHPSYAVSEADSSRARRFHWDNVPIPGGHIQSCLYGPLRSPVDLAATRLLPTSVPFPAPSPLKSSTSKASCVFVWDGLGGYVVTNAMVRPWKACGLRGPVKTEGSALPGAD